MEEARSRRLHRMEPARKWRCHRCPRQFVRRDHLQRHERGHTRTRPFTCPLCSKAFSRRDVLLRHTAQVHEMALECEPLQELPARDLEPEPSKDEPPADERPPRSPSSSSTLSVPSDLEELLLICSDPSTWTNRDRTNRRRIKESASQHLATTRPWLTGEHTDNWKTLDTTAHSPILQIPIDLTDELPEQDSLAASRALGLPQADLDFLLGLHRRGHQSSDSSHQQRESMGAITHINFYGPDLSSPLVDHTHGLGKCLDTLSIQALISTYTGHFVPNLPFIHHQTLDLDSALNAEFPNVKQRLFPGTRADLLRRPFYKSLFLSMLSHGAAYAAQPILARRLHEEAAKAIQSELAALSQRQEAQAPIHIIQAMIHQIHLGLSFGDLRLEECTLSHIRSLMALVQDAMLFEPPPNPRARISCQSVHSHYDWLDWVDVEERKRTFFAVVVVMSAVLTMFNSTSLDVRSIQLALPCQEFLWQAKTVRAFKTGVLMGLQEVLFQDEYGSLFKREENLADYDSNTGYYTDYAQTTCSSRSGTSSDCNRIENLTEFGCLILISALSQTIWKWKQSRKNCSNSDQKVRDVFRHALNRWRARLRSVESVSFKSPQYRLLIGCMPILDNVELLLKVDITSAKEALHRRRYGDVGVYVNMAELQNNSGSSSSLDNDFLDAYDFGDHYPDTNGTLLYDVALYSAKAVQLSIQKGPWWSCKNASVDLPLHTAVTVFHCVQILCTWLLFLQEKTSAQNGTFSRQNTEVENDDMLLGLCRRLAKHSLSRLDDSYHIEHNLNNDAMPLAVALAQALANFFQKQSAWPVLNHLAKSLEVRVTRISDRADTPLFQ